MLSICVYTVSVSESLLFHQCSLPYMPLHVMPYTTLVFLSREQPAGESLYITMDCPVPAAIYSRVVVAGRDRIYEYVKKHIIFSARIQFVELTGNMLLSIDFFMLFSLVKTYFFLATVLSAA